MADAVCEDLIGKLKTDTNAKAVAVRDLLAFGDDSVYESGDLSATSLNEAEADRREAGETGKALFLVIQDAGESRDRNTDVYTQTIVARIVDRLSGYHNIREVRKALLKYLREPYFAALDGGYAATELEFIGRSGHQYDRAAGVEFEAITFKVHVDYPEED